MKIKTTDMSYEKVLALPKEKRMKPKKPNMLFRTLLKTVSEPDIKATNFKCNKIGMETLGKDEPCVFLMNHSSFLDLKIAATVLYPRPFNIICTSDGFVGKSFLMRNLGCIPTQKFVFDLRLVKDMMYAIKKLKSSILMYPEASYSFDGKSTPLPESVGKCLKALGVPVVMISTHGAFARDPLYNGLRLRKVDVSADMEYILSPEELKEKSIAEINSVLKKYFSFDNFLWQKENGILISEPFRAEGLNRVLYKCPHCLAEGKMQGSGCRVSCKNCGAEYELTELGELRAINVEPKFTHIPDWYGWERESVREELLSATYELSIPVDIKVLVDTKSIYNVGSGNLVHNSEGFRLTGCGGKLDYRQKPSASYSLYADYFWYEIGDMVCIGDSEILYYCFPQGGEDVAAKTRLATEELYKLCRSGQI